MTRTDFSGWRKALPIALLSGQSDPVGDFGKGVKALQKMLNAQSLNPVLHLIPDAGHALLWQDTPSAPESERIILEFLK